MAVKKNHSNTMKLTLVLALGALILNSCKTVQPDEKLQKFLTGDIFAGTPTNPADEKKLEQGARESERVIPHKEEAPGVGLKMQF